MNTARLLLTASAVLLTLGIVAAAWAAPGTDGGSRSGGARALPVVPSGGGGSEPAPDDSAQLGGTPGVVPETIPAMPPTVGVPTAAQEGTETTPDEELVVPLEDLDAETTPSDASPALQSDSSGGAFSFLATTGFEIATLITVGAGLLVAGVLLRRDHRAKAH